MQSEFVILEEEDEEDDEATNDEARVMCKSPGARSHTNTRSISTTSDQSSYNSRIRGIPSPQSGVVPAAKRRQSVAGRLGFAIVRGITAASTGPKTGISAAREREIAAEWEQFEKEKKLQETLQRSKRKSTVRPVPVITRSSDHPVPVITRSMSSPARDELPDFDTLSPLPVANKSHRLPTNNVMTRRVTPKGVAGPPKCVVGAPKCVVTADATDLNIMWRVQARKAEGKMTTPEQMAKLRLMLKQENTGSRRSRNSVYSIDPSLLERPGRIREINSMEEFQERLDQAKEALVCVTFSAKWCGPWRMIKPDVHRLSHIHGDVEFYEIDVDDNEEIAEARRVACMPTFQFFKRGIMLDKFAEPNRIKLDETIRKLRKMEIRPEE